MPASPRPKPTRRYDLCLIPMTFFRLRLHPTWPARRHAALKPLANKGFLRASGPELTSGCVVCTAEFLRIILELTPAPSMKSRSLASQPPPCSLQADKILCHHSWPSHCLCQYRYSHPASELLLAHMIRPSFCLRLFIPRAGLPCFLGLEQFATQSQHYEAATQTG
jgi:hypothetical protein